MNISLILSWLVGRTGRGILVPVVVTEDGGGFQTEQRGAQTRWTWQKPRLAHVLSTVRGMPSSQHPTGRGNGSGATVTLSSTFSSILTRDVSHAKPTRSGKTFCVTEIRFYP